jgi:hypothetical protein
MDFTLLGIAQLAVDVVLLVLVVVALRRSPARPRPAPAPPAWSHEAARLAREILAAIGPILDALEARPRESAPPAPRRPLLPAEERLVRNLAGAVRR